MNFVIVLIYIFGIVGISCALAGGLTFFVVYMKDLLESYKRRKLFDSRQIARLQNRLDILEQKMKEEDDDKH